MKTYGGGQAICRPLVTPQPDFQSGKTKPLDTALAVDFCDANKITNNVCYLWDRYLRAALFGNSEHIKHQGLETPSLGTAIEIRKQRSIVESKRGTWREHGIEMKLTKTSFEERNDNRRSLCEDIEIILQL